ncbi:MAG: inorganic diphosphatase [Candidatus Paceibacterota bacterium]|jgi:inorganic pyrophosphatase
MNSVYLELINENMQDDTVKSTDYATKFIGSEVEIKIDRALHSKHPKYDWSYELNYGFVPGTASPDGEEIDAYLLGVNEPVESYKGKCIAVIHRLNDNDDKLVVIPTTMDNVSDEDIQKATNFQEQFFKSEITRGSEKK